MCLNHVEDVTHFPVIIGVILWIRYYKRRWNDYFYWLSDREWYCRVQFLQCVVFRTKINKTVELKGEVPLEARVTDNKMTGQHVKLLAIHSVGRKRKRSYIRISRNVADGYHQSIYRTLQNQRTRLLIYKTFVVPIPAYWIESWTLKEQSKSRIATGDINRTIHAVWLLKKFRCFQIT